MSLKSPAAAACPLRTVIIRRLVFTKLAVGLLSAQTAEVTTKETAVTFRSGTNLVPVSVVVRDSRGHAVGNLGIDDFQLFDNGKPQLHFEVFQRRKARPIDPVRARQTPLRETSRFQLLLRSTSLDGRHFRRDSRSFRRLPLRRSAHESRPICVAIPATPPGRQTRFVAAAPQPRGDLHHLRPPNAGIHG